MPYEMIFTGHLEPSEIDKKPLERRGNGYAGNGKPVTTYIFY
jgi:hypothetical protein